MEENQNSILAIVSSYGTVTFPEKRYRIAFRFENKKSLMETLKSYLQTQVGLAVKTPLFQEELEDIDLSKAFDEINKTLEEVSPEINYILEEGINIGREWNERIVLTLPSILTDYHVEFYRVSPEEMTWLAGTNEIGVLAADIPEGFSAGEFMDVVQLYNTDERLEGDISKLIDKEGLEKWRELLGEASEIPLN